MNLYAVSLFAIKDGIVSLRVTYCFANNEDEANGVAWRLAQDKFAEKGYANINSFVQVVSDDKLKEYAAQKGWIK